MRTRGPFDERMPRAGLRAGSRRRPRSRPRLRRRVAAVTVLGATLAALATTVAVGLGLAEPARRGADVRDSAGPRTAVDAPASRAVASRDRRSDDEQARSGRPAPPLRRRYERVLWRDSQALGRPSAGALLRATKLPAEGRHFFGWDPELRRSPSPAWRRYATDRLIRVVLRVAEQFARANPIAPRLAVGDLSRPRGGHFGARYSSRPLHASHQNGLDVDIYYPRRDRREEAPRAVGDIDIGLSQDLVDRFVRTGAQFVFVGPNTPLTGPRGIVQSVPRHDNHLHVRLPPGRP